MLRKYDITIGPNQYSLLICRTKVKHKVVSSEVVHAQISVSLQPRYCIQLVMASWSNLAIMPALSHRSQTRISNNI